MSAADDASSSGGLQPNTTLAGQDPAGGYCRLGVRTDLANLALLLPALLVLGLFFYLPIVRLMAVSFGYPTSFSFASYVSFATEPVYLTVLMNTVRLSLLVTLVSLLLSYPVAYLMSTLSGPALGVVITIVLMPFWTSLLARTFAWMILLGRNGVINRALINLGLINQPLELIHNTFGAVLGSVQILLPFMILPIYASVRKIDPSLLTAATSLGASPVRKFFRVFLPLTLPGVVGGCVTVFILTTGFYIVPALMGGPRDSVIAPFIYMTATTLLDTPMAAAMAVVLLFAVLVVYLPVWRSLRLDTLFSRR
jgi:putative spermidine/putrescine transport system permease protein